MTWKLLEVPRPTREEKKRFLGTVTFYADANLDASIVEVLRILKHDVVTAWEIHSEAHPDEFHFKYAFGSKRVLLTQDKDYLDNDRYPLNLTRGVIVFNVDFGDIGQIARALEVVDTILSRLGPVLDESKVIVNSDYSLTFVSPLSVNGGFEVESTRYRLDTNGVDVWIWEDD